MHILLADDQAKVRSALRLMLENQPHVHILGEAVDATGLQDWINATCPDIVLLDWELPGFDPENGLLSNLRVLCPSLSVIALSGQPEARQSALDAGADAFVSKGDPPECLLVTIENCQRRQGDSI